MNRRDTSEVAELIADRILDDLLGRSGFDAWWNEVLSENNGDGIIDTWQKAIKDILDGLSG